jgi:hypothetical protein
MVLSTHVVSFRARRQRIPGSHGWAHRAIARFTLASTLTVAGVASIGPATAGALPALGPAALLAAAPPATSPAAYWLVAGDGGVFTFGGVPFRGSAGGTALSRPIVAMASTPSGNGYWMVSGDGHLFAFGDAPNLGTAAGLAPAARPTAPVVGIAPTPSGQGYWETAANGSVYSFGDAPFLGSMGGVRLNLPVVGMSATRDGKGYWLVASDGGMFSFGDAVFHGSTGGIRLNKPIVGMTTTNSGGGYWLVASDGGMFSFGDAVFHGSTGGIRLNKPIVGMSVTPGGGGYWLVASDGGMFTFGDALFRGSTGGRKLNSPIVGMAVGHTLDPYTPGSHGFDISWPQCGSTPPTQGLSFGIIGINDGRAFTHNPCLASQLRTAPLLSAYINLNAPPAGNAAGLSGPAGRCGGGDTGCMAYNYGYNAALDAYNFGIGVGVNAGVWWIDVETGNAWDSNTFNNSRTIQGALDALRVSGVVAGIYSTFLQFPAIAGAGYLPGGPIWVPYSNPAKFPIDAYCTNPALGFAGGTPWVVQSQTSSSPIDQDLACN